MTETSHSIQVLGAGVPVAQPARFGRSFFGFICILAVASLVLHHGFQLGIVYHRLFNWIDVGLAGLFCLRVIFALWLAIWQRERWREHRLEFLLVLTFGLLLFSTWELSRQAVNVWLNLFHQASLVDIRFGLIQLFLLSNVCLELLHFLRRIFVQGVRLELILAGSFGTLILVGSLLLLLPRAAVQSGNPISLTDAVFTTTSAACVTGLVVRDTGGDFSTFGQLIILAVIQIGGLGIITFVAFISVFSAKSLPVPQMTAFRQVINAPALSDVKRRIAGIVVLTALIEAAGAASLYGAFAAGGEAFARLKWCVFHSISAFCNAGFALQSNSLEFAKSDPIINMTLMVLIVLGGLGFLVIPELIGIFLARVRMVPIPFRSKKHKFLRPRLPRLSVQTRLSLWVTFWLIVAGLIGFWALEATHILAGKSVGESFLISGFQSITTRTTGFNTVPIGDLQPATLVLLMILMVIGGCPVSAAGGIKTVTFGILLLALRSMIGQKERVEAFGRTLPPSALFTALSVFVLYVMAAVVGVFLLAFFDPHLRLRDEVFEMISALSTVGLSTGITAQLSVASKLVLCAAMFIGRVGPLALVLSVFQARRRVDYEFPSEEVVVG